MSIKNIISEIKKISGSKYIITENWRKQPYSKGWRYGKGNAFAVVTVSYTHLTLPTTYGV